MSWQIALAGFKIGESLLNYYETQKANKQYLQQLYQKKLLTRNAALSDINSREEMRIEEVAINETVASAGGYDPFDSGSFKAINDNVNLKSDEDIANIELGMQVSLSETERSLNNLRTSINLAPYKLAFNVALAGAEYNNYLGDLEYTKQQQQIAIKNSERVVNKTAYRNKYGKLSSGKYGFTGPRYSRSLYEEGKGIVVDKDFAKKSLFKYRQNQKNNMVTSYEDY